LTATLKVVMKFGGSLLASPGGIPRVSGVVSKASKRMKVVVVISALGEVTDLLLQAATDAKTWDSTQVIHFVDRIRGIHSQPLAELGLRQATYNESVDQLEEFFRLHGLVPEAPCPDSCVRNLEPPRQFRGQIGALGRRMSGWRIGDRVTTAGQRERADNGQRPQNPAPIPAHRGPLSSRQRTHCQYQVAPATLG